jgi:hypothetical protein
LGLMHKFEGQIATPAELIFGEKTARLCGDGIEIRRFAFSNDDQRNGESGSVYSTVSSWGGGTSNEQDLANFSDNCDPGAGLVQLTEEERSNMEAELETQRNTTEEQPTAAMNQTQMTGLDMAHATREQLLDQLPIIMGMMDQMRLRILALDGERTWENSTRMETVSEPPLQEPLLTAKTPAGPTQIPLQTATLPNATPASKRPNAAPPEAAPQKKTMLSRSNEPNDQPPPGFHFASKPPASPG